MSTELRLATPSDYEDILRHIDAGFSFEPGTFLSRFPNHWRFEMMDWEHMHLAVEDGEFAAYVRVFPLDVVQNGARFRVGGIGAVSTAPWARGRGHMSALLNWTNQAMRDEGFAIAILDGDRHRYRPYGYEAAGRAYQVSINARGLKRLNIPEVPPIRYTGQPGILAAMTACYETQPYRRLRPTAETPWIYQSSDFQVWASNETGSGDEFGYLVLEGARVGEWGGNLNTVLGLIRTLQSQGTPNVLFRFPDPTLIPPLMYEVMGSWLIVPSTFIQVLDDAKVREAYGDSTDLPTEAELQALDAPARTRAFFGGLSPAPFNFFLPKTERV